MIARILKISVISLIGLILLAVIVEGVNFLFEKYQFEHTRSELQFEDKIQFWAHAGRHDKFQKGSPEAFRKAFEIGAKGVEIDCHYDTKLSRFVLSHNFPYRKIEGRLMFLEEVFQEQGPKGYYWIDLKNLSMDNYEAVAEKMTSLINRYKLKGLVFIESFRGKAVSQLSNKGLQTIYWVDISGEPGTFQYLRSLHRMRSLVRRSNFYAMSMAYKTFLKVGGEAFSEFPLFVFTINNKSVLDKVTSHPHVRVILTDLPEWYNEKNIEL